MKSDINVLIINTDPQSSAKIEKRLKQLGFSFCSNAEHNKSVGQLEAIKPDIAILDPSLDQVACHENIYKIKMINPCIPVLTSCEDLFSEKFCNAPFEGVHYLGPNLDPEEIECAIENAFRQKAEYELLPDYPVIIGQSREVKRIRQKILAVADKDIAVLVTGETGTGKELVARSIHCRSLRKCGPLVKVDCASLPDELLESEVFGFQKGAFTDAHQDKPGRLELADGGTLFIDEIGDLSLSLQAKFLQLLEDKEFSRLGGIHDRIIDTRVVAATNSDLLEKVRDGAFRKDLFYRLNVVHLEVPPLRMRKDDTHLLTHYFINKYCHEFKKEILDVPDKIAGLFVMYHWPGNVRELENVIRRAIVLRDWNFIFKELNLESMNQERKDETLSDSHPYLHQWDDGDVERFFKERDFSLKKICKEYVSKAERQAISSALQDTQWNRQKAAKLLQVSYKTLLTRIAEFNLRP